MISKPQKKELNALIHKILELRDGVCLHCGSTQNLQASHIYPKGVYRKLEFDTDNIIFLCYRCHLHFWHKNPIEAHEWLKKAIVKSILDRLKLRSQTSGDGSRDYKILKLFLTDELKKYETAKNI